MSAAFSFVLCIRHCLLVLVVLALFRLDTVPAGAAQSATSDYGAIDAYIAAQMNELRIPGLALGIVQGDQIVHLKGFGVAGTDGRPVTPQTPFRIDSLGKPMTASAVMQLVEAGKLDLDVPVQRYLPWFRVADEAASAQITPRHLLYHTSGLPTSAGMEYALRGDDRPDALEQRIRALRSVELNGPVGQAYEYSNAGYMVLGLLVQEIGGQSYEAYMHQHLFAPLAMGQTFTDWTQARAHGVATGYQYWFGVPRPGEQPIDRALLPAGAHTSASAEDVAHFLIAHLNGGRFSDSAILSAEGIAEMQRPALSREDGPGSQPMGWELVTAIDNLTTIIKAGDSVSFKSVMLLLPERRLGLVMLMNANKGLDSSLGDQRQTLLSYNVVEMLLGQEPTRFPADPKPTLFYAFLFLVVIVQVAGMVRTSMLLRPWRDQPSLHPQSGRAFVMRLGLPLLCNLGWSLVALVGVPKLFGMPLAHIIYAAPDFGYTLLVSGVVALVWGVTRTTLRWRWLRPAHAG